MWTHKKKASSGAPQGCICMPVCLRIIVVTTTHNVSSFSEKSAYVKLCNGIAVAKLVDFIATTSTNNDSTTFTNTLEAQYVVLSTKCPKIFKK